MVFSPRMIYRAGRKSMATDDKIMVAETIYLYATGIDTKDFNLYRSIFADKLRLTFLRMKDHLFRNPIS
ncbi:MAG: hypothetical protein Ct9H90mP30_6720 [Actinomycetota bacterium]|nr:MAG: hypothetical protein Ct9H90mP30_6720 [Actinomycetota bacterium]